MIHISNFSTDTSLQQRVVDILAMVLQALFAVVFFMLTRRSNSYRDDELINA